jgi:Tfp pilus assembly protein PilO
MTNGIWKIATALVCIAVLTLGVLLGIMPRLAEAEDADESRVAAEATNAQHEATLAFLREENERIDEIQSELDELRAALPEGPEYSTFVTQLGQLATSSGVTFTETTTGGSGALVEADSLGTPAQGSTVIVGIPTSITVLGTYPDIVRFIRAVQEGQRLFQLSTIIVNSSEEAGIAAGSYTAAFTGLIFAFTDAPVAPADPNAVPAEGEDPAP